LKARAATSAANVITVVRNKTTRILRARVY
jgi:hypothetical protein